MEWSVVITGENCDLEELSKSLNSPEQCVIREGEEFILKSTDFSLLNDANDVRNRADEILSIINGTAMLALGMRKPLVVTHVAKINDDGTRHMFISLSCTINLRDSVSVSIIRPDGNIQEIHKGDAISSWVTAARNDINVAKALRLFGTGIFDWVSLYRIYEVIESDVGGLVKIKDEGWATKKAIKRFKYTANSPAAIGDDARHGKGAIHPPEDPMVLSEAKSLIETILHNWLRSKRGFS